MEEVVGFVDMSVSLIQREEPFMNIGQHLSGKGAVVLRSEFIRCICTSTI